MNAKGKIQAQLSAYLDGELDEAQLRQVEEALESDGAMRVELAQLAAARKLLRGLPTEKPSVDLVSRVLAEAERSQLVGGQHAEAAPNPLRWVRYVASAAVLLMAATVGMVIAVTLCSPGTYEDNLVRHNAPANTSRDEKDSIAVAGSRSTYEFGRKSGDLSRDIDRSRDARPDRWNELDGDEDTRLGGNDRENGSGMADDRLAFDNSGMAGSNGSLPVISGKGGGGAGANWVRGEAGGSGSKFANVDRMAAVLGGDLTNNEIIYSDRLDDAQKQVEQILVANSIAPVVTEKSKLHSAKAKDVAEAPLARGNFYIANRLSPAQVQYEAYVTLEQMEKVQDALGRLRARQNVSQDPSATALALANGRGTTTDGGWGSDNTPGGKVGYRYKKECEGAVNKVDNEARSSTIVTSPSAPAAKVASDSPADIAKSIAKGKLEYQTQGSQVEGTGVTADDGRVAQNPAATQPPAPAPAETPSPSGRPAMPGKRATPAPPVRDDDIAAGHDLAMKTKPADPANPEDKKRLVAARPAGPATAPQAVHHDRGGAEKETADRKLAQLRTPETSPAIQTGQQNQPTVATGTEPDLLARRSPLGTLFEDRDGEPSTRPVGQAAGPIGGQYMAGTPNVRVTPPAVPPRTPTPGPDRESKEPIVEVTVVNGAGTQRGGRVSIEVDRLGQAAVTGGPATRPAEMNRLEAGLATAIESQGKSLGYLGVAPAAKADQPVKLGEQERFGGAYNNAPTSLPASARVQRLLITLNYRNVGEVNTTLNRAAAKIQAAPTSRATTSQTERVDQTGTQQQQTLERK